MSKNDPCKGAASRLQRQGVAKLADLSATQRAIAETGAMSPFCCFRLHLKTSTSIIRNAAQRLEDSRILISMKKRKRGSLSPRTRNDNKSSYTPTEQDGGLIEENHAAKQAEANKPKYRLGRSDDGVFFWQDDDTLEQGTFETTDEREAERLLNLKNEMYRDRILRREWTVGDLVQLISGGPTMTTVGVRGTDLVICAWMRGNKLQEHNFKMKALRIPQPTKHLRSAASKRQRKSSRK